MPEANPLAAPDAPRRYKILERYLNPEHRVIAENKKIYEGQQHERMELPVTDKVFLKSPGVSAH